MSIGNRIRQGIVAAIGTAAITALTIIRIGTSRDMDIDVKTSAMLTAIFSLAIGAIWSFMPRAIDDLDESVDAMKEELTPAVKTAFNSAIEDDTPVTKPYTTRTYSSSSSYDRGFNKVRKVTDDDFNDDDDFEDWTSVDRPWSM